MKLKQLREAIAELEATRADPDSLQAMYESPGWAQYERRLLQEMEVALESLMGCSAEQLPRYQERLRTLDFARRLPGAMIFDLREQQK